MHNQKDAPLTLRGHTIRTDQLYNFCLDDIFLAANETASKAPGKWRESAETNALMPQLFNKTTTGYGRETRQFPNFIYTRPRDGKLTFAHPAAAVVYAGFLSPSLETDVRSLWLQHRLATINTTIVNRDTSKQATALAKISTRKAADDRLAACVAKWKRDLTAIQASLDQIAAALMPPFLQVSLDSLDFKCSGPALDQVCIKVVMEKPGDRSIKGSFFASGAANFSFQSPILKSHDFESLDVLKARPEDYERLILRFMESQIE